MAKDIEPITLVEAAERAYSKLTPQEQAVIDDQARKLESGLITRVENRRVGEGQMELVLVTPE